MPGRLLVALVVAAVVLVVPGWVASASAQEVSPGASAFHLTPISTSTRGTPGSSWMKALYVATAAMQALDWHSTERAFQAGAVEGNPLLTGLVKNRYAFVGMKAGVAASTILASRGMAKRSRVTAAVTLLAINSVYGAVVAHNYRIAHGR